MLKSGRRAGAFALAGAVSVTLALSACGGGDDPGETTSTTTDETAATVDAAAFKDCMLSSSVDRGVYDEVMDPASQLQDLADSSGAELFEAGKADDGFVSFFVLDDPANADSLAADLQTAVGDVAAGLADQAGTALGQPSVETQDSVVLGLIPFSPKKEGELTDETLADVSSCIDQIGTA